MKFNVFAERGADAVASTEQIVARLRARVTTTNHPPAPMMAMVGEMVVHGDDIRRPMAMVHHSPEEALVAVAGIWKNSNLLIGAKRRIADVKLKATDVTWQHGDAPRREATSIADPGDEGSQKCARQPHG